MFFYKRWFDLLNNCINNYIFHKEIIIRPRDKKWMNSKVRSAIRKRNRLLKKFNRLNSITNWNKYKQQRNYTTFLIRDAKANYYKKLNENLSNPLFCKKKWWSSVKSLINNKIQMSIPSLREDICLKLLPMPQKRLIFSMSILSANLQCLTRIVLYSHCLQILINRFYPTFKHRH